MPEEIELNSLDRPDHGAVDPTPGRSSQTPSQAEEHAEVERWAWTTACMLALCSIPLLFWPKLVLLLANPDSDTVVERTSLKLSPLEHFLAVHIGLGFLNIAVSLLVASPSSDDHELLTYSSPTPHPLLIPTTLNMIVASLVSYNFRLSVGTLATITTVVSGFAGIWGAYATIFGGSRSISRTTGADKRTSRFIFGNRAAARAVKKRWRAEHGEQ